MNQEYIIINEERIPINIKNVSNSKSIKIYVKNNILQITKSKYCPKISVKQMINENQEKIYEMYKSSIDESLEKLLYSDMQIMYKGNLMILKLENTDKKEISIKIEEKQIIIYIWSKLNDEEKLSYIKKNLKEIFKNNLTAILNERIPYWSKITNIDYLGYSIKQMTTRYGSCNTRTGKLNFNINLLFMPENVRDTIIVHELCHIIYPNHSQKFYDLINKYIPEYDKLQKWLKVNSKYLKFL